MHNKVFEVNMLSPSKPHVKTGKIKYEAANPAKRDDHTAPVSATINCVPCQKHSPTGME